MRQGTNRLAVVGYYRLLQLHTVLAQIAEEDSDQGVTASLSPSSKVRV